MRTALGASRGRIARQLLVECALMAVAGGLLGLGLSRLGLALSPSAACPSGVLPYWFDYSMDGTVAVGLVVMALATLALFAVVPAWQASRAAVIDVLKDGGQTATGRRGARRWGTGLLAVELGLAVIVTAQLGVATWRSSRSEIASDAVLDDPGVLTAAVTLPALTYRTTDARRAFHDRWLERLAAPARRDLGGVGQPAAARTSARTRAAHRRRGGSVPGRRRRSSPCR